jgi:RNA polymerase subunit RPABC4/transcription elongation factor Spt4
MATTPGKTIALIIVITLIILAAVRLTPIILAPFGFFTGMTHAIRTPGFDGVRLGPLGHLNLSSFSLVSFALFFLWIAVIVWVYRDAERRGMNGVLWALLVFIGNLIGLIIYLIVRQDNVQTEGIASTNPTLKCPSCAKSVSPGYKFCPHCGSTMNPACAKCNSKVERDWNICPNCGEKLKN